MLILKALQLEPMHGWGITERIEQWSESVLQLGQGTLYPALTGAGPRRFGHEFAQWQRMSRAVNLVLETTTI